MGTVSRIFDRLSNVMSGQGTTADRRVHGFYHFIPVTPDQAEAAYRTSWLMRKIIDTPPLDMTRNWRSWQADKNDIEALEAAEKKLQLREKCKRALVLARLWGGGALIIGTNDGLPSDELNPERVGRDGLAYVHVVGCHQLGVSALVTDPASPWFGQPESYQLSNGTTQIDLHPSRVIPFVGQRAPEGGRYTGTSLFWGDPLMQSIDQAVKNADLAQDGFAALIDEAKVDIIKIPDMMQNVGTDEYEKKLLGRLGAAAQGKSTWRALMLDGAEEWDQRQITWTGMPDIISSYLQIVAGAADIPITRLLGTSPKGLQSSGDGEERDYHAMIAARQDEMLAPALDRLDEVLVRSALGKVPSDVWYKFNPLSQITPKDAAEIEAKRAAAVKTYADTGLFPEDALAAMAKNAVIESGQWPGSEAAFEESSMEAPFEQEPDPNDLLTAEEIAANQAKGGDPTSRGAGGAKVPPRRAAAANDAWFFADARPVPLYVQRKLLNAADLIAWAKAQGFKTTLPASDMHVTVLNSRQAVDPMKMGETWTSEADGGLTVKPGGPRAVERLGDSAVVLLFASWSLASRHAEMVAAGASHDWDEYQPHVTISFSAEGVDLEKIKPFAGELRFGPEVFEPLNLDWKSSVVEDGGSRTSGLPFGDARRRNKAQRLSRRSAANHFDPSQPRDRNGRWIPYEVRSLMADAAQGNTAGKQVAIGTVGKRLADKAAQRSIAIEGKAVALDRSGVRHTIIRHASESRTGQKSVRSGDIAAAATLLNNANALRAAAPAGNGASRFIAVSRSGGQQIYMIMENRKKAVALVTMWVRG